MTNRTRGHGRAAWTDRGRGQNQRGLHLLRLDTNATLTEARAMYRACGYREIPAYGDHVYADHWFEKRPQANACLGHDR